MFSNIRVLISFYDHDPYGTTTFLQEAKSGSCVALTPCRENALKADYIALISGLLSSPLFIIQHLAHSTLSIISIRSLRIHSVLKLTILSPFFLFLFSFIILFIFCQACSFLSIMKPLFIGKPATIAISKVNRSLLINFLEA